MGLKSGSVKKKNRKQRMVKCLGVSLIFSVVCWSDDYWDDGSGVLSLNDDGKLMYMDGVDVDMAKRINSSWSNYLFYIKEGVEKATSRFVSLVALSYLKGYVPERYGNFFGKAVFGIGFCQLGYEFYQDVSYLCGRYFLGGEDSVNTFQAVPASGCSNDQSNDTFCLSELSILYFVGQKKRGFILYSGQSDAVEEGKGEEPRGGEIKRLYDFLRRSKSVLKVYEDLTLSKEGRVKILRVDLFVSGDATPYRFTLKYDNTGKLENEFDLILLSLFDREVLAELVGLMEEIVFDKDLHLSETVKDRKRLSFNGSIYKKIHGSVRSSGEPGCFYVELGEDVRFDFSEGFGGNVAPVDPRCFSISLADGVKKQQDDASHDDLFFTGAADAHNQFFWSELGRLGFTRMTDLIVSSQLARWWYSPLKTSTETATAAMPTATTRMKGVDLLQEVPASQSVSVDSVTPFGVGAKGSWYRGITLQLFNKFFSRQNPGMPDELRGQVAIPYQSVVKLSSEMSYQNLWLSGLLIPSVMDQKVYMGILAEKVKDYYIKHAHARWKTIKVEGQLIKMLGEISQMTKAPPRLSFGHLLRTSSVNFEPVNLKTKDGLHVPDVLQTKVDFYTHCGVSVNAIELLYMGGRIFPFFKGWIEEQINELTKGGLNDKEKVLLDGFKTLKKECDKVGESDGYQDWVTLDYFVKEYLGSQIIDYIKSGVSQLELGSVTKESLETAWIEMYKVEINSAVKDNRSSLSRLSDEKKNFLWAEFSDQLRKLDWPNKNYDMIFKCLIEDGGLRDAPQYFKDVRCWILQHPEGTFKEFLEFSSIDSDTSEGVCVSIEGNDVSSDKRNKRGSAFFKISSKRSKSTQKSEAEVVGISASDKADYFFAVGQTYQAFTRIGSFNVLEEAIERINKRDQ